MGTSFNLPNAYSACYDLLLMFYKELGRLPRDVKYTLLERMKSSLVHIAALIFEANINWDKTPYLIEARGTLMEVMVGLRLLYDLHYINEDTNTRFAEKMEDLSKQLTAWYKYQNKSAHSQNSASL